jgi:hypothetical protein
MRVASLGVVQRARAFHRGESLPRGGGGCAAAPSSFSLADLHEDDDLEEDEDAVVDAKAPQHGQAAMVHTEALAARQLRATSWCSGWLHGWDLGTRSNANGARASGGARSRSP